MLIAIFVEKMMLIVAKVACQDAPVSMKIINHLHTGICHGQMPDLREQGRQK